MVISRDCERAILMPDLRDFRSNLWVCKKANPCSLPGAPYKWLSGYLGDPLSRIMFLAENPSLTQMEKVGPDVEDENNQWNVSTHDAVFRKAHVESGFKDPPPKAPGGWHCHISDIVKCGEYRDKWKKRPRKERVKIAARCVSRHLSRELQIVKPVMIVLMGNAAEYLFRETVGRFRGAEVRKIHHYTYVSRFEKREYKDYVDGLREIRREHLRLREEKG